MRHSVSSQKHSRSASEPPPRATIATSTSADRREVAERAARSPARRGGPGPARSAHTSRPAQPRRASAASTSSRALPLSPVITPIVRGSSGRGSRFWRSSSPSASSCLRRRSIRASRSPSPATRRSCTAKEKPGRGGGAARVVVAAAGDDHLHALARRAARARDHRLPVRRARRARDRAGGVAQLEVHARARRPQVDELADQLHARERAQLARAARRRTRRPETGPASGLSGMPAPAGLRRAGERRRHATQHRR